MPRQTDYINTDLNLKSRSSLSVLCSEFDRYECVVLHHEHDETGQWFAVIESPIAESQSAADDIRAILTVLPKLSAEAKAQWKGCDYRDFNIGFDCGDTASYQHDLPVEGVLAVASANCSISVTLYAADASR